ncbi:MAG: hypothetical protein GJ676_09710 [Rhodobacteraceae bacterium]|nr:hypothetical protein [Paracoccaceae bacterium]
MHVVLWFLVMILVTSEPVSAGAWLREKGTGFLSVSTTARQAHDTVGYETSIYSEYGLTQNMTIGVDLNQNQHFFGHTLVFARFPLARTPGKNRFALELGLGGSSDSTGWSAMQKVTLSFGRGFDSRFGPGWMSLDLATELRDTAPKQIMKFDATVGLSGARRLQPMLQIETSKIDGKPLFWSVTPSLRYRDKGDRTWLFGIEHKEADKRFLGAKIGLWKAF